MQVGRMSVESMPSAGASKPSPIHVESEAVAANPMGVAENARYVVVEVNVAEEKVTVTGAEVVKICVAYVAPELEENGIVEVESAGSTEEVGIDWDTNVVECGLEVNEDLEELAAEAEAALDEEDATEAEDFEADRDDV